MTDADLIEQAAVLCSAMASNDVEWIWDITPSLIDSVNHFELARKAVAKAIQAKAGNARWALACSMLRSGEVTP